MYSVPTCTSQWDVREVRCYTVPWIHLLSERKLMPPSPQNFLGKFHWISVKFFLATITLVCTVTVLAVQVYFRLNGQC